MIARDDYEKLRDAKWMVMGSAEGGSIRYCLTRQDAVEAATAWARNGGQVKVWKLDSLFQPTVEIQQVTVDAPSA